MFTSYLLKMLICMHVPTDIWYLYFACVNKQLLLCIQLFLVLNFEAESTTYSLIIIRERTLVNIHEFSEVVMEFCVFLYFFTPKLGFWKNLKFKHVIILYSWKSSTARMVLYRCYSWKDYCGEKEPIKEEMLIHIQGSW